VEAAVLTEIAADMSRLHLEVLAEGLSTQVIVAEAELLVKVMRELVMALT
jgi:hypothetical protein